MSRKNRARRWQEASYESALVSSNEVQLGDANFAHSRLSRTKFVMTLEFITRISSPRAAILDIALFNLAILGMFEKFSQSSRYFIFIFAKLLFFSLAKQNWQTTDSKGRASPPPLRCAFFEKIGLLSRNLFCRVPSPLPHLFCISIHEMSNVPLSGTQPTVVTRRHCMLTQQSTLPMCTVAYTSV